MKRWTNGLPGATKRPGAMMALRGLSPSQPGCADTHGGPEQKSAPLRRPNTLLQLSRSSILEAHLAPRGRAIHIGTTRLCRDVRIHGEFRRVSGLTMDSSRPSLAASGREPHDFRNDVAPFRLRLTQCAPIDSGWIDDNWGLPDGCTRRGDY